MKPFSQLSLSLFALALSIAPASAVEIKSVSVGAPTKAHLCIKLGGKGQDPTITIKHAAKAGDTIRVKMYDVLSNGRTFQHKAKTIKSDASGTTVMTADFLPPCNTTGGQANSSYRFDVTSSGSKTKTVRWFDFNSKTRKIGR
jgi:hypothetical protein